MAASVIPPKGNVHRDVKDPEGFAALGRPPYDREAVAWYETLDQISRSGVDLELVEWYEGQARGYRLAHVGWLLVDFFYAGHGAAPMTCRASFQSLKGSGGNRRATRCPSRVKRLAAFSAASCPAWPWSPKI